MICKMKKKETYERKVGFTEYCNNGTINDTYERLRLGPVMQRKRRFMNLAEPGIKLCTIRRCGVSLGDVLWVQSLSGGEQISRLTGEAVPSPVSAHDPLLQHYKFHQLLQSAAAALPRAQSSKLRA